MEFMTVEEVAEKLKVNKSWVYDHADDIGVLRCGKYLRFIWPRVVGCIEQLNRTSMQPDREPNME